MGETTTYLDGLLLLPEHISVMSPGAPVQVKNPIALAAEVAALDARDHRRRRAVVVVLAHGLERERASGRAEAAARRSQGGPGADRTYPEVRLRLVPGGGPPLLGGQRLGVLRVEDAEGGEREPDRGRRQAGGGGAARPLVQPRQVDDVLGDGALAHLRPRLRQAALPKEEEEEGLAAAGVLAGAPQPRPAPPLEAHSRCSCP